MLEDGRWIAWQSAIVTSFLFVVGISLASRDDRDRRREASAWFDRIFLRRWAQIAGAAALVTVGSAILFPESFIYFGVLHFIAVALWLCRPAPRLGAWAVVLGLAVIAVGLAVQIDAFDPRWIDWIGFAANKPITEDYVSLFPWLGVVLIGCGAGALSARHDFCATASLAASWNALPIVLCRALTTMGRWSLTI